jgi:hypothetical protein
MAIGFRGRFALLSCVVGFLLISCVESIPRIQSSTSDAILPRTERLALRRQTTGKTTSPLALNRRETQHLRTSSTHDGAENSNLDQVHEPLRVRGGGPAPRVGLHREDTMLVLKEYFTNAHLLPITNRNEPLQDAAKKRGMLGSVKWGGLVAALLSYAWILLAWPGGELKLKGVAIPAARRCLAIVSLVSVLWATEAVPLHITSLMVPLLTVVSAALPSPGGDAAYPPSKAAKEICGEFFNPTILLFLAGFSIGAVLEKQKLSKMLASAVLRPFGNRPDVLLLGMMMLGTFMSMWISNIPSSVLCTSLAQPILAQARPSSASPSPTPSPCAPPRTPSAPDRNNHV